MQGSRLRCLCVRCRCERLLRRPSAFHGEFQNFGSPFLGVSRSHTSARPRLASLPGVAPTSSSRYRNVALNSRGRVRRPCSPWVSSRCWIQRPRRLRRWCCRLPANWRSRPRRCAALRCAALRCFASHPSISGPVGVIAEIRIAALNPLFVQLSRRLGGVVVGVLGRAVESRVVSIGLSCPIWFNRTAKVRQLPGDVGCWAINTLHFFLFLAVSTPR